MPDNLNTTFPGADTQSWLKTHAINEVECFVPDVNGVLRGKTLPVAKFLKSLDDPKAEKRYPDFRHALGTQYVCDAVLESAKTGQWVNVKKA